MTHSDFNQLLSSIKTLSPTPGAAASPAARPPDRSAEEADRSAVWQESQTRQTSPGSNKSPSIDELHRKIWCSGLITRLPDPSLDIDDDDPDDQPVPIKGEPLSETILRERR